MPLENIDDLYDFFSKVLSNVQKTEPSFSIYLEDNIKKMLIISGESQIEVQLKSIIKEFIGAQSKSAAVPELVNTEILERGLFRLLDIDKRQLSYPGIKRFLGKWGETFKDACFSEIQNNTSLQDDAVSFMQLFMTRNQILHKGYLSGSLDKSLEDCYELYKGAENFISEFKLWLENHPMPAQTVENVGL